MCGFAAVDEVAAAPATSSSVKAATRAIAIDRRDGAGELARSPWPRPLLKIPFEALSVDYTGRARGALVRSCQIAEGKDISGGTRGQAELES